MSNQFKIIEDHHSWLIEKLIKKLKNNPNKVKDSLYDNLTLFDKIKLLFKKNHDLLDYIKPQLVTLISCSHFIMFLLSIIIYILFTIKLFIEHKSILGFLMIIFIITLIFLHIYHYVRIDYNSYTESNNAIIFHYILAAFTFALPIIILEILIAFFVGKGHKDFKKYINEELEDEFVGYFNQAYYNDENVVYLKHEIIKDVKFNDQSNIIEFDYINKDLISVYNHSNDRVKRVLINYIKEHTSRELNFKQLLNKLLYLDHLNLLDESSKELEQQKEDKKLLNEIMNKQLTQDEITNQQIKFNKQ